MIKVDGTGTCGKRPDGRFGFTRMQLHLTVATAPPDEARARELAAEAEANCLVSASLDFPVETVVDTERRPARG